MPIYVTDGAGVATNQAQVTLGAKNIVKVYWGSVLKFAATVSLTLNSDTNVNLQTFIEGQTALTSAAIVVTIPAGEIIGSTNNDIASLVTGDLSAYTRGVTLIVNGEIQGAGGKLGDLNGGDAFGATTNLTIINNGAIRGGGGAGGNGGTGGYGSDLTSATGWRDGWSYSPRSCYRTPVNSNYSSLLIYWDNSIIYNGSDTSRVNHVSGSYTYQKGSLSVWEQNGELGTNGWYNIRRGINSAGTKGSGGTGGVGQGYNQARTSFTTQATNGTRRAGAGGAPGAGGDWAQGGSRGGNGGTGLYIGTYNSNLQASGTSGTNGGVAGKAIDSGTATVTLQGDGIINGQVI